MLDRIVAVVLLLVISPVLLLVLIIVAVEDGYPVIFSQKRVGRNGKKFRFYKVRTMKRNAPEMASKDFIEVEKFLLKSGAFFRKSSIDEIPNLINIVKGDMKFIGPRPLLASEENIQHLRRRYAINTLKPGITGWAQVNGRDAVSDERKVVLERYYLRNRSFTLDLHILWRTAVGVLRATGVRF
jgi:O-antigen biosynthesis protein WbqP